MIRFGVAGTNWITDRFIAAAKEAEGAVVTAVYSRTQERGRAFADKHGIPHAYDDLAAMASSGTVDAVYIASPNSVHAEQSIACMEAGLHVLCEKPLASNAVQARRMIEAAKRHGVTLMEAVKSTLLPNFREIVRRLPELGTLRRYSASYCQYSSRYDAYRAGTVLNAFNPELSNGALMDLGIYCLYPAVVLFGRPRGVKANGMLLSSGADGGGSMLLDYGGMEGVVQYSKISNSYAPSEIQGEEGSLLIHGISEPVRIELRLRDGREETISMPQSAHNMVYEIEHFAGLVRDGRLESDVNSHDVSLAVMELMDEARRQIGLVYPADRTER